MSVLYATCFGLTLITFINDSLGFKINVH